MIRQVLRDIRIHLGALYLRRLHNLQPHPYDVSASFLLYYLISHLQKPFAVYLCCYAISHGHAEAGITSYQRALEGAQSELLCHVLARGRLLLMYVYVVVMLCTIAAALVSVLRDGHQRLPVTLEAGDAKKVFPIEKLNPGRFELPIFRTGI